MSTRTTAVVKRRRQAGEIATRRVAIRNHCLECVGYNAAEVVRCTSPACWLYPYRLGGSPEKAEKRGVQHQEGAVPCGRGGFDAPE